MVKELKDFLFKGSLLELAVAVILAGAFGKVIGAFTDDIIGGILAKIVGKPNFDSLIAGGWVVGTPVRDADGKVVSLKLTKPGPVTLSAGGVSAT